MPFPSWWRFRPGKSGCAYGNQPDTFGASLLEFTEELAAFLVIIVSHAFSELLQCIFLLPVQVPGGLNVNGDVLVAPAPAVEDGNALAPQPEHGAGLGALGDGVFHPAVDGGDLQLRAQHRLGEGDGGLAEHGGALPAEDLVGPHHHGNQQVAAGAAVGACVALAPQGDGLAVVDTGGDVHLNGPALANAAAAVTVGAGLVNDLAGAPALLAGALALHDAKGRPLGLGHGAGAVAIGAHLRRGAVGAAVALTGGAGLAAVHRHGFFAAEGRLREVYGDAGPDALAPAGAVAPLLAAAEAAAEER